MMYFVVGHSVTTRGMNYPGDLGTCIWDKMKETQNSDPNELIDGTISSANAAAILAGLCTSLLMWNKEKFLLRKISYPESYSLFNLFILTVHLKVILPKIFRFAMKYAKPEYINCEGIALLETFLNVLEIEALTHLCIERYVVAKYITRGWPINRDHYKLYFNIIIFSSLLYSLPPVFYLGNYALDFNCETCTFDMVLPHDWTRYAVVAIFLLRSIKPVMFMIVMLFWSRKLELKFTNQMKLKSDRYFTRLVEIVTMSCLVCWAPLASIRGCVIFSQLKYGEILIPDHELASWAMTVYELAPLFVTLAIILTHRGMIPIPAFEEVANDEEKTD